MKKGNKDNSVGRKIFIDVISKTVWLAVSPIITALGAFIWSLFQENFTATIISVVSLIISVITFIIVILLKRFNSGQSASRDDENQSDESIVPKFKASYIEAEFYFINRETMQSRIEYNMKLTCPNMREYPRSLLWSGSEYNGTKMASDYEDDYEIEEQVGPQSPHEYLIKFKDEKKLGEFVKFKTITNVGDKSHIMKNYYSYTVTFQIETLVLRISAPKGLIKNVKKSVYADRGREILVETPKKIEKKIIGDLEEYRFTYKNPTLLYNYFIDWEFTKA